MNKNEIFQLVKKLSDLDISVMLFRETVFDIISFGKSSKIHLATTASPERIKHVLTDFSLENAPEEKNTLKFSINNDICYIHSIFGVSYDDFIKNMVATDLTFNSLLMKPNGQIFDMYNGLADLKNKRLSFVDSFSEENKTRLVLNCIRYIYKNGFTADDKVKEYIKKSIPALSKNERNNALFYLVEHLDKSQESEDIELILCDSFFANDKNPNVHIGDYKATIERIGKEKYIYLLLLLSNVNINKTRFTSLIDAEKFNDIKKSFALDFKDEMTYYNIKDTRGYEYLSDILTLQKEYALLTQTEYTDPVFHQETVFDMLEQSETASVFTDDMCFEDDEEKPSITEEVCAQIVSDETQQTEILTPLTNSLEENNLDETIGDAAEETKPLEPMFEEEITKEDISDIVEHAMCQNNVSTTQHMVCDIDTDDYASTTAAADDIGSLLNVEDDRANTFKSKKRNINPNMRKQKEASATNNDADVNVQVNNALEFTEPNLEKTDLYTGMDTTEPALLEETKAEDEFFNDTTAEPKEADVSNDTPSTTFADDDTVPVTPVVFVDAVEWADAPDSVSTDNAAELPVATDFSHTEPPTSSVPAETPKEELFSTQSPIKQNTAQNKASLIDDIFEEEVKVPEIELSSDFGHIMEAVAQESKSSANDYAPHRRIVDENMMMEQPASAPVESQDSFEISDKELEDILAELNGRGKSTFLDDDTTTDDDEGETLIFTQSFPYNPEQSMPAQYNPQSIPTSKEDNDFFQSLNDDFTEIIGGSN